MFQKTFIRSVGNSFFGRVILSNAEIKVVEILAVPSNPISCYPDGHTFIYPGVCVMIRRQVFYQIVDESGPNQLIVFPGGEILATVDKGSMDAELAEIHEALKKEMTEYKRSVIEKGAAEAGFIEEPVKVEGGIAQTPPVIGEPMGKGPDGPIGTDPANVKSDPGN